MATGDHESAPIVNYLASFPTQLLYIFLCVLIILTITSLNFTKYFTNFYSVKPKISETFFNEQTNNSKKHPHILRFLKVSLKNINPLKNVIKNTSYTIFIQIAF